MFVTYISSRSLRLNVAIAKYAKGESFWFKQNDFETLDKLSPHHIN